jgi:hypothetical protein
LSDSLAKEQSGLLVSWLSPYSIQYSIHTYIITMYVHIHAMHDEVLAALVLGPSTYDLY